MRLHEVGLDACGPWLSTLARAWALVCSRGLHIDVVRLGPVSSAVVGHEVDLSTVRAYAHEYDILRDPRGYLEVDRGP